MKKAPRSEVLFYCFWVVVLVILVVLVVLVILEILEGVVSYFSFLKVSRMLQALDKIACNSSILTRSCAMVSR